MSSARFGNRPGRLGRWLRHRRWPHLALLGLAIAVVIGYGVTALDSAPAKIARPIPVVALSTLPVQVDQTIQLIKDGGPFPYSQDGVVFDNNEHLLPAEPHGDYHEYTVTTPGASDRATRRLVTGPGGQLYYTADHYESFQRVDIEH